MKEANNDIEDSMDEEDSSRPGNESVEMIQKEAKKQVGKEVQKVRKSLQENSSAEPKTKCRRQKRIIEVQTVPQKPPEEHQKSLRIRQVTQQAKSCTKKGKPSQNIQSGQIKRLRRVQKRKSSGK